MGSNLGDRLNYLQQAVNRIDQNIGAVQKISGIYNTPALGFKGNEFLNACVKVATFLPPEELLERVIEIEKGLGRIRKDTEEYENRTIDIDILLFDDEIVFNKELVIPHPRLLERNFVLTPLNDIASSLIHPIKKESISKCLKSCKDNSLITRIEDELLRPIPLTEKYNYIAIEGNIGAGKTSLAKMLGEDYNTRIILERFADNPFLPKFYEDKERYALPLEMSFLADRYQQLSDDLAQFDLFKNSTVSDYYIFKSLLFAQVTLQKEEYALYRKIFDIMYNEITKPDLYIFLYQNIERLMENIKKRGRTYEQNIEKEYLERINEGYANFIKTEKNLNILVIDVTELDFVNSTEDYQTILKKIKSFQ